MQAMQSHPERNQQDWIAATEENMNGMSLPMPEKESAASQQRAIAPVWHTLVVVLVLLAMSLVGGILGDRLGRTPHARVMNYLVVIVVEWVTVWFIAFGVRSRRGSLSELVGGKWARFRDFLRDLGIALGFMLVCGAGVLNGLGYLLKVTPNQTLRTILPQSVAEMMLWVVMSLTAGFCEETIFRGYLQRQFTALTRGSAGGIVLQGIAFGAAHGYQGWKFMFLIAVYGTLFGLLAHWRGSLRPGMIAHGVQDTLGGLLARFLMR